jgi:large subunit ribosomal protein L15
MMAVLRRPNGAQKQRKRLGRGPGSGNGTTAGRGTKGQNSRSGGGVRPGFEGGQMPLYRRVARRGFSNYRHKVEYVTVNVGTLEERFDAGATVDLASLHAHRLIGSNDRRVKILGDGRLTKKLTVVGLSLSASAREKIEAAGGSIQERSDSSGTPGTNEGNE